VIDNKVKGKHRGVTKDSLVILFCMLCVLTGLGSSFVAAEKQEGKPKKPRFELSEKTLVDSKTKLMWPLNGHLAERTVSWNGAYEFIDAMNKIRYGSHKNWRLPTREELETLVGYVQEQGFGSDPVRTVAAGLHALGMKDIKDDDYWTSTEHIYNSGEAWFVNLKHGRAGTGMKTLYFSILPVRSVP